MNRLSRVMIVVGVLLMLAVASPLFATGSTEAAAGAEGTHRFSHATGPWDVSQGRIPVSEQPEDPYFQYIEQTVGVAPLTQSWEWEGSTGYVQGLRLALAGGEEFGAIMPWSPALVQELVDGGRVIPLDDYLEDAPYTASIYTDEVWDSIRTQQGGQIYYIPQPQPKVTVRAGFIRQDWLDRVGLDVPTTKEELLEVYRAFRDQDANGNGDPNDEIPVSGREQFRWFDDLFMMHGVAMFEGHPQWRWNEAEGIFESDQVSDAMFESVVFINQLYQEGLMDVAMPAQTNADWTAKLNDGRIGHYFHLVNEVPNKSAFAFAEGGDETGLSHWAVMPHPPIVDGIGQQPYVFPNVGAPRFMMLTDAEEPDRIIEWLEWGSSPEGRTYTTIGIEGFNYIVNDDGEIEVTNPIPAARYTYAGGFGDVPDELLALQTFGELKVQFMNAVWPNVVTGENMLMPNTVYDGFTDFLPNQATMYRETIGQMITGQLQPTRANWDAYVEEWYAAGGQVVTDRATEWYREFYGE
jgi:putative aldouronate transport system substrate-binding protein